MRVVLAGATGFVGRRLYPALLEAGHDIACGTRRPEAASARRPDRTWVHLDVDAPETLGTALEGADVLVYLVHQMGKGVHDLREREVRSAEAAVAACERAGVGRIVYLGAPEPEGTPSEHLAARLETGKILRSGGTSAIELQAGMIIGVESESWTMVRDLSMRLPMMVLPRWLHVRSQPIAVGDVIAALTHAVANTTQASFAAALPGPEVISARALLDRVAAHGGIRPLMVDVPVLTPRLSSHWIRLITRADYAIAKKLVDGLTSDIVCPTDGYFEHMPEHTRTSLDDAILHALRSETGLDFGGRTWERAVRVLSLNPRE